MIRQKADIHEIDFRLRHKLSKVFPLLVREQCQKSFYTFFQTFWDVVVPGKTGYFNWHVQYLCDQLQELAERVFRNEIRKHDLIINVPPGSTKTTICTLLYPAWIWTRMGNRLLR
jgi:hypothetical protein